MLNGVKNCKLKGTKPGCGIDYLYNICYFQCGVTSKQNGKFQSQSYSKQTNTTPSVLIENIVIV